VSQTEITGGCLCGQVRYVARAAPQFGGECYCRDCQRASGSAFIPFMGFAAKDVSFTGETRIVETPAFRGGAAVRNFCPVCGSLVFGGIVGVDEQHTVYAGTLDDTSVFKPTMVIFNRDRPAWAPLPDGVAVFETMPSERPA
jgi:hypothetical protein